MKPKRKRKEKNTNVANSFKKVVFTGLFILLSQHYAVGQEISFQQSLNQGLIRIAETGQLADTLNLWGDVRNSGRYLVPRNTNLTELISYARGPVGLTNAETWSKVKLEIYVSRYNPQSRQFQNRTFDLQLNEPLPQEMQNYPLENGDVITLKAKRRPSFRDYFTIIAPILSLGFTAFLTFDRLSQ